MPSISRCSAVFIDIYIYSYYNKIEIKDRFLKGAVK